MNNSAQNNIQYSLIQTEIEKVDAETIITALKLIMSTSKKRCDNSKKNWVAVLEKYKKVFLRSSSHNM